jgi:hypothetical protein
MSFFQRIKKCVFDKILGVYMYIFFKTQTPSTRLDVKNWLVNSLKEENTENTVGIVIIYIDMSKFEIYFPVHVDPKHIEWVLLQSFKHSNEFHGLYYSNQINKYGFHVYNIIDEISFPEKKYIKFPNMGFYNTREHLIQIVTDIYYFAWCF